MGADIGTSWRPNPRPDGTAPKLTPAQVCTLCNLGRLERTVRLDLTASITDKSGVLSSLSAASEVAASRRSGRHPRSCRMTEGPYNSPIRIHIRQTVGNRPVGAHG